MKTILGIDEAGRGPVIGPLVLAGVKINKVKEKNLINIGVKDSKMLSVLQREKLYESIMKIADATKIVIIEPKEIDSCLNSDETNLNWLEADKSIEIIKELNADTSILDSPSVNVSKYRSYVQKKVKSKITAEHKADEKYPVVSAASILAKVTRDNEINKIKKEIGIDFGSGYPSDERTQEFLRLNYNKYDFFRKTWASYKKVAFASKQTKLQF